MKAIGSRYGVSYRYATPDDIELLEHWDEQSHVKAAIGDDDDDWHWREELGRKPQWREFLIAQLPEGDGLRPIGFVQIIDPALEDSHYWGEVDANLRAIDIWIGEASDLGQGYGTEMMHLALQRCFADKSVTAVLIDPLASNIRAQKFYRSLGFSFLEERVFENERCSVFRLDREEWQAGI